MDTVAIFAGQTITVGAVASFLAELAKRKLLPGYFNRPVEIRLLVASACVVLNAGAMLLSGGIDVQVLLAGFLSYLTASATYLHLFKE